MADIPKPVAKPLWITENPLLLPEHVVESATAFSPQILAAKASQQIADASVLEAQGAFDRYIEQEASSRFSGFYDGNQLNTKIVQPFAAFNSEVYGGYRISDGSFPIYEDKLITTEEGEAVIGLKLSLARNRVIDARRLNLMNATLSVDLAEAELKQTNLILREQALLHYWEWLAAGFQYQIYQELLDLANKRQNAFSERVRSGDLPKIYLVENEQYILQRQTDSNAALQKFIEASNKLSLYYRDLQGQPVTPTYQQLPEHFNSYITINPDNIDENWWQYRPEIRLIDTEMEQLDNTIDYGQNLRLPKADLSLEHGNDFGSGPRSREQAESIAKLNITIPLQQRRADGYIQQSAAKKQQLQHERTLLKEQLQIQYNNLQKILALTKEYIDVTNKEIDRAITMQEAEQIRINSGASDYFLLILRDENLAKAQIKLVAAKSALEQIKARLYVLTSW